MAAATWSIGISNGLWKPVGSPTDAWVALSTSASSRHAAQHHPGCRCQRSLGRGVFDGQEAVGQDAAFEEGVGSVGLRREPLLQAWRLTTVHACIMMQ
jgi:hypothetical protein